MSLGYLLDTVVLSATAPGRRQVPDVAKQAACRWIEVHGGQLWLPVIAKGEIASGIGEREGIGATRHASELAEWLQHVPLSYPERILGYGMAEARCCRQLGFAARRNGIQVGFADMSVASIAVTNDLVVATRNVKDFTPMDIEVVNPFDT